MGKKIISLWSTPRSRSTAFMWMMMQRGDLVVIQEPFGRSAYYSEERIFDRAIDVEPKSEYNYQNVLENLRSKAEKSQLFIKDFAYYFPHIVDDEFLQNFHHTFLIRDPAQALPSYYHKMPTLEFKECGYKELFELFQKVVEMTGKIPVVINANDLVTHPVAVVHQYCLHVNLPFIPEALEWKTPGNSNEIGWWDDKSWNDDLRVSTVFQSKEKPYLKIHESEKLQSLYDLCVPYYEKLKKHCLDLEISS